MEVAGIGIELTLFEGHHVQGQAGPRLFLVGNLQGHDGVIEMEQLLRHHLLVAHQGVVCPRLPAGAQEEADGLPLRIFRLGGVAPEQRVADQARVMLSEEYQRLVEGRRVALHHGQQMQVIASGRNCLEKLRQDFLARVQRTFGLHLAVLLQHDLDLTLHLSARGTPEGKAPGLHLVAVDGSRHLGQQVEGRAGEKYRLPGRVSLPRGTCHVILDIQHPASLQLFCRPQEGYSHLETSLPVGEDRVQRTGGVVLFKHSRPPPGTLPAVRSCHACMAHGHSAVSHGPTCQGDTVCRPPQGRSLVRADLEGRPLVFFHRDASLHTAIDGYAIITGETAGRQCEVKGKDSHAVRFHVLYVHHLAIGVPELHLVPDVLAYPLLPVFAIGIHTPHMYRLGGTVQPAVGIDIHAGNPCVLLGFPIPGIEIPCPIIESALGMVAVLVLRHFHQDVVNIVAVRPFRPPQVSLAFPVGLGGTQEDSVARGVLRRDEHLQFRSLNGASTHRVTHHDAVHACGQVDGREHESRDVEDGYTLLGLRLYPLGYGGTEHQGIASHPGSLPPDGVVELLPGRVCGTRVKPLLDQLGMSFQVLLLALGLPHGLLVKSIGQTVQQVVDRGDVAQLQYPGALLSWVEMVVVRPPRHPGTLQFVQVLLQGTLALVARITFKSLLQPCHLPGLLVLEDGQVPVGLGVEEQVLVPVLEPQEGSLFLLQRRFLACQPLSYPESLLALPLLLIEVHEFLQEQPSLSSPHAVHLVRLAPYQHEHVLAQHCIVLAGFHHGHPVADARMVEDVQVGHSLGIATSGHVHVLAACPQGHGG